MAEPMVITSAGLKKLENELEILITVRRKEIAESIKQARDYGDLSENSEYDAAKNEQAEVEARISQIENMLQNIKVVDEKDTDASVVSVGSKVRVYDEEFDEKILYTLVGPTEADPANDMISYESPIGKALLGKRKGDEVNVLTPGGEIMLKILKIEK